MILCLESASKNCSVALANGEGCVVHISESADQYIHAEKMHLFVEQILADNQIKISDLQAIAIGTGPGSYTGLRIGTALAKGMAYTLNIPLIACSSLRATLQYFVNQHPEKQFDQMLSVIDARRMEVYCQHFDRQLKPLSPIEAIEVEIDSFDTHRQRGSLAIIGEGAEKLRDLLPKDIFIQELLPNAAGMAQEAWQKFTAQQFEDLAYYEPIYFKEFRVGKKKGEQ